MTTPGRRRSGGRLPADSQRRAGRRIRVGRVPAAAVLVALGAILGACGATPNPSPVPTPAAPASLSPTEPAPGATPAAAATPGPDATPLRPAAFTFDLPDGWQSVPVGEDHADLVAALTERNPAFAESLGARLDSLPPSATYVAFDGGADAVTAGDVAMLTVTEVDLPADVTLTTFARTIQDQVQQLVENEVELRKILVAAGEAYSIAYFAPITRPDGQTASAAVTQVLYVVPGRGYVATFATSLDRANDYAREVADIATSFTLTP